MRDARLVVTLKRWKLWFIEVVVRMASVAFHVDHEER
jgi:hypothetical protein